MRILIIVPLVLILAISCGPEREQSSAIIQLEWKDERSTLPARIVEVKEVGRTPVPKGFLPLESWAYSGPPFWRKSANGPVMRTVGPIEREEGVESGGQSTTYTWEIREWDMSSGEITHTVFDPPPPEAKFPPFIFSTELGFRYLWAESGYLGKDTFLQEESEDENPDALWVYGSDGKLLRRVAIDKSKNRLRSGHALLPNEYPWNSSLLFVEADRIEVKLQDVTRLAETCSRFDLETGSLDRLDDLVRMVNGELLMEYSEREGIYFFAGSEEKIPLVHKGQAFYLPPLFHSDTPNAERVPVRVMGQVPVIPVDNGSIFMFRDRSEDGLESHIAVRLSDNLLTDEHKAGLLWDNPGPDVFMGAMVVVDPSEQRPYLVQVDTNESWITVFDPLLGTIRAQVQMGPPGQGSKYSVVYPEYSIRTEPRVFVLDRDSNEVVEYKLEFREPAEGPEITPIEETG